MPTKSVEHPQTETDPLRWHFIYKRKVILDPRRFATLANGIAGSWAAAIMLIAFFLSLVIDRLAPFIIARPILGIVPCGLGVVGPMVWIYWNRRPEHMALVFERDLRRERLRRIVQNESNAARVPHRFVEWAYRRSWGSSQPSKRVIRKRLKPILPMLASQTIVIVGRSRSEPFLRPQRMALAFEPIAAADRKDCEQFVKLCLENMEVDPAKYAMAWQGRLLPVDLEHPFRSVNNAKERRELREERWKTAKRGLLFCAGLLLLLWLSAIAFFIVKYMVGQLLFGSERYAMLRRLGFVVCVLCTVWSIRLLVGRKTWLVPGGLLIHRHPFWRRRGTVRYCRCAISSLVVDTLTSKAYIVHNGDVHQVYGGWATLAAWVSLARPPTKEEVRSFMGADVKCE